MGYAKKYFHAKEHERKKIHAKEHERKNGD
jgi:hypothetical protein